MLMLMRAQVRVAQASEFRKLGPLLEGPKTSEGNEKVLAFREHWKGADRKPQRGERE
jgi:hypothetical protein